MYWIAARFGNSSFVTLFQVFLSEVKKLKRKKKKVKKVNISALIYSKYQRADPCIFYLKHWVGGLQCAPNQFFTT